MFERDKDTNNILIHAIDLQFPEQGRYKVLVKEGGEIVSSERDDVLIVNEQN